MPILPVLPDRIKRLRTAARADSRTETAFCLLEGGGCAGTV